MLMKRNYEGMGVLQECCIQITIVYMLTESIILICTYCLVSKDWMLVERWTFVWWWSLLFATPLSELFDTFEENCLQSGKWLRRVVTGPLLAAFRRLRSLLEQRKIASSEIQDRASLAHQATGYMQNFMRYAWQQQIYHRVNNRFAHPLWTSSLWPCVVI